MKNQKKIIDINRKNKAHLSNYKNQVVDTIHKNQEKNEIIQNSFEKNNSSILENGNQIFQNFSETDLISLINSRIKLIRSRPPRMFLGIKKFYTKYDHFQAYMYLLSQNDMLISNDLQVLDEIQILTSLGKDIYLFCIEDS